MTALERDLVDLAKLARKADIRPTFAALRDKHGADVVAAKLNQAFGQDGAAELLQWLVADDPAPVHTETPQKPDVGPKDEFPIVGAVGYYKGRKESPANATIDKQLYSASIEGGNVRLKYDALNGWKVDRGEKDLDGHVCIAFVADDGTLIAGRFDHKKVGQTVKTMANIGGGIISGNGKTYTPKKGQDVGFFILDRTGKLRTNTVRTSWR